MPVNTRTPVRLAVCGDCSTFVNCGAVVEFHQSRGDRRRELDDAIEILVVDLVGGIRRLVVVGMRAGRERQARHAGLVEGRDVGRLIRIRLQLQIEAGRDVRALEDATPTTGLVPVACATSLLSCIRPTMSKLRYAAT